MNRNRLSAIGDARCATGDTRFAIGYGSTWLTMNFQDAVYAKGALGVVEVAVRDDVMIVVVLFNAQWFDDAGGGFIPIGGIVGDFKLRVFA